MSMMKKLSKSSELLLPLLFLALFVFFSIATEHFFQLSNIMLLFAQMVELGLLTMAMSVSIISGGMDLSIGTLASLCTVLFAIFMGVMGIPMVPAVLMVLAIAIVGGMINGFMVGHLKVTAMLATLGTSSMFTGIGMLITSGATVVNPNPSFSFIGQYKIGGIIPFQLIIFGIAIFMAYVLFGYTRWGRRIYMIGSNPEVARFAGINIKKDLLRVYLFSAVMACMAGMVLASRVSSGRADIADSMVLRTVAASVLGGISINGGSGRLTGAMMGVAIFAIISNGLSMMRVSSFLLQVIIGGILLLVLVLRQVRVHQNTDRKTISPN